MEVVAHVGGGPLEGETAGDEDDEFVDQEGVFHHVRGADDGAAGIREVAEQAHELEFRGGIEAGSGLVEEKNRRLGEQLDGDAHALALAAGEPPDREVGALGEAELVEGLREQAVEFVRRGGGGEAQARGEAQGLPDGQVEVDDVVLGNEAEGGWLVIGVNVLAIDLDGAALGLAQSGEGVEQRGFARAAWTDEAVKARGLDVDGDAVQDGVGARFALEAVDERLLGDAHEQVRRADRAAGTVGHADECEAVELEIERADL